MKRPSGEHKIAKGIETIHLAKELYEKAVEAGMTGPELDKVALAQDLVNEHLDRLMTESRRIKKVKPHGIE